MRRGVCISTKQRARRDTRGAEEQAWGGGDGERQRGAERRAGVPVVQATARLYRI